MLAAPSAANALFAAPPVITAPADGASVQVVHLVGTTDPGTRVVVSEDGVPFDAVLDDATHWHLDRSPSDGQHTYSAHSVDGDGVPSAESPVITVTVDTVAPPAPVILDPPEGALLGVAHVDVHGTVEDGARVDVFADGVAVATGVAVADGAWSAGFDLADGAHTLTAKVTDAAGNVSDPSAPRGIVVDTVAPDTTISGPAGPTNAATVTFALSASEPAGFTCELDAPGGPIGPGECEAQKSYDALPEGDYVFKAFATDAAGHADPSPAVRSFTIDRTPPAAPTVSGDPSALSYATEPGATLECSLDGGPAGACAGNYSALPAGSHRLTVRATDRAGNRGPETAHDFTIAAAPPPPTQQPAVVPSPTPAFHATVVVRPAAGHVFVRRPGSAKFVEVTRSVSIPLGSTIDTKHGAITLLSVPRKGGRAQKAVFNGGIFRVSQPKAVTVVTLTEALAPCGRKASAAKRKPKTRRLWGSGSGAFSTHGRYSAASIRGTRWLVQDSCAGTLTRVLEGVVTVRDDARRRTVLLRAGKRYLARPHH